MPRVVLLAGPSGSGKSHLARSSGLPVVALDDFYREGDDPKLPRHPELGIVDWDHLDAWDAARAVDTLAAICATGSADIPVYDIAHDRVVRTERFTTGASPVFVAEGLFASEIAPECRERGILADVIVVLRKPWKNFVRRLVRDLAEQRKPPLTLLRRGLALWRAERSVLKRQVAQGCRAMSAAEVRHTLASMAVERPDARMSRVTPKGNSGLPDQGSTVPTSDGSPGTAAYRRSMSTNGYDTPARRLVRPRDGRVIAGVCAGLARRYGLSTTVVRVIFVLLIPLPGPILIIYLALWLIMPSED